MFNDLYDSLSIGVVVCDSKQLHVIYANPFIRKLTPICKEYKDKSFGHILGFSNEFEINLIKKAIFSEKKVNNYTTKLINGDEINIIGNTIKLGENDYFVFYIDLSCKSTCKHPAIIKDFICSLYTTIFTAKSTDDKINIVLKMIGNHLKCSRAYIYEKVNYQFRNSYEWLDDNINNSIQNNTRDNNIWSRFINSRENFLCNDTDELDGDKKIFLKNKGIKSILLAPLNECTGFIGIDECFISRVWSIYDEQMIQSIVPLLSFLTSQKLLENSLDRYSEITKNIFNNMSANIYVRDIETYEILFVNITLAKKLGYKSSTRLEGKKCWEIFYGNKAPCGYCPAKKIIQTHGIVVNKVIKGEMKNHRLNEWYFVEDSLIEWVDNKTGHLQIGRPFYNFNDDMEAIEHYASIDPATGMYKKDWGLRLFHTERERAKIKNYCLAICYFDVHITTSDNIEMPFDDRLSILKYIILSIKKSIRETDIIFNWSENQFILLLAHCTSDKAANIIQKINSSIKKDKLIASKPYKISLNAGIQEVNSDSNLSDDEIIKIASKKMYIEKFNKKKNKLMNNDS